MRAMSREPGFPVSPQSNGRIVPLLFLAALIAFAAVYWNANANALATRWNGLLHDRNGHLDYALKMAVALRDGNVPRFVAELSKGKTWPPLHGLVACTFLVMQPDDWRLAMLPSLFGWVLMLFAGSLLAYRLAKTAGAANAWFAAAVTLFFAIESPAHRAFALDVMLESLGAGLTMMVLYCYSRATSRPYGGAWWKASAISLTLLFFEKYNYWMITALSLGVAELFRRRMTVTSAAERLRRLDWRSQLRDPLNWLIAILSVVIIWITLRGPTSITIAGKLVSLYPPRNLLTIAFATFVFRIAIRIRKNNWRPATDQTRAFWYWHVLPITISLLLPQRLAALVGFLSPTNYGDAEVHSFAGAMAFYGKVLGQDYHTSGIFALIAALLALAVVLLVRRITPAHVAVIACLFIGLLLVIAHPNQKSRFMHSWIPCLWVLAGIGSMTPGIFTGNRYLSLGGPVALMGLVGWIGVPGPAHSRESGHRGESGTLLTLSDEWLSALPKGQRICFIATQPCRPFVEWTFLQQRPAKEFEWKEWPEGLPEARLRNDISTWLAKTDAQTVVVISVPPRARAFYKVGDRPRLRSALAKVLSEQTRYAVAKEIENSFFGTRTTVLISAPAGAGEDDHQ